MDDLRETPTVNVMGDLKGVCLVALEYANKYSSNVESIIFVAGSYIIPVNKDLIDL